MQNLHQRDVTANGIRIHYVEQGTGPLVLLCHGFPKGWYSWRDQLAALAAAGYRAVAPDMRGYGRTDAPADIAAYSVFDIVGDVVGLVTALGEKRATIVGHDWGASIAWHAALFRPDVFPAVAALSIPNTCRAGSRTPTWITWRRNFRAADFAAASTGTATSIGTGSSLRPGQAH